MPSFREELLDAYIKNGQKHTIEWHEHVDKNVIPSIKRMMLRHAEMLELRVYLSMSDYYGMGKIGTARYDVSMSRITEVLNKEGVRCRQVNGEGCWEFNWQDLINKPDKERRWHGLWAS